MTVLGKFGVIMADPPWEIHQDLPYGTMADDEMRKLNIGTLQDEGVIFLWVTGEPPHTLCLPLTCSSLQAMQPYFWGISSRRIDSVCSLRAERCTLKQCMLHSFAILMYG